MSTPFFDFLQVFFAFLPETFRRFGIFSYIAVLRCVNLELTGCYDGLYRTANRNSSLFECKKWFFSARFLKKSMLFSEKKRYFTYFKYFSMFSHSSFAASAFLASLITRKPDAFPGMTVTFPSPNTKRAPSCALSGSLPLPLFCPAAI